MKVVAWYDNEIGYSAKTVDLLEYMYPVSYTHLDVYKRQALPSWANLEYNVGVYAELSANK